MSAFTATSAQDVVAVLGADLTQVFPKARAIRATISRESKAMEHPLETGSVITDHRIIQPIRVELSMLLVSEDYRAVYQQIVDLFIKGELLTVQTRVDSFPSMLIEKIPHDETADIYDGVALALSLKEAKFVEAQFSEIKVEQSRDSNAVKRGTQQSTDAPPEKTEKNQSAVKALIGWPS